MNAQKPARNTDSALGKNVLNNWVKFSATNAQHKKPMPKVSNSR
ncbi:MULTISPECIES: hypothetical protein [unclassified Acinetobacter]|nr:MULTISPECIES: hypothetical protein [unclassified Acinetobacter]